MKIIRSYAFHRCTKLQTINLENVVSIGKCAFEGSNVEIQSTYSNDEGPDFLFKIAKAYLRGDIEMENGNRIMQLLQIASEKVKIDAAKDLRALSHLLSDAAFRQHRSMK